MENSITVAKPTMKQWFSKWALKNNLRTLEYQNRVENNLEKHVLINHKKMAVLAACPSAGKTIMGIAFIEFFLECNPTKRVLITTHGTTILRTQFYEDIKKLKPNFTYECIEEGKDLDKSTVQVIITLPQTISKLKKLPKFDLFIVDEAHHYYFAEDGMIEQIINKAKPTYKLFLTGSPSKFIRENNKKGKEVYPIIPVTLCELLEHDMVSDLIVELAMTPYKISLSDYNGNGELNKFIFKERETNITLDLLLKQMEKRLKSSLKSFPKVRGVVKNVFTWDLAFRELTKTMFACKSQQQAKQVANYFKNKGINVALSISDEKDESREIMRFQQEKDCLVLIVVGRGILGLNYPELVNVVDMTGSQNIDRIFQLMCRVTRKHPNNEQKLFFKVVSEELENHFENVIMRGVLALCGEEFYTKFDGRNFDDLYIPVAKTDKEKIERHYKGGSRSNSKKEELKKINYLGVPFINFFQSIMRKKGKPLSSYAFAKIRDMKYYLGEVKRKKWTKEEIMASIVGE